MPNGRRIRKKKSKSTPAKQLFAVGKIHLANTVFSCVWIAYIRKRAIKMEILLSIYSIYIRLDIANLKKVKFL